MNYWKINGKNIKEVKFEYEDGQHKVYSLILIEQVYNIEGIDSDDGISIVNNKYLVDELEYAKGKDIVVQFHD